jgi:predicted metal-dependent hydrolase
MKTRWRLKSNHNRLIFPPMERPIEVDLPHKLGRDEAHRRIANNIHKLQEHIPGGASHVDSDWVGDRLNLNVHAMGQSVEAQIDVEDTKVHCRIQLPGMLSQFAAPIEAMLKAKGSDLLLEDKR